MIDFHVHSGHSVDAKGNLQEYCDQALKVGLKEICFTNHCELDLQRNDNLIKFNDQTIPITHAAVSKLNAEIMAMRELYADRGLSIRSGLEIGYFTGVDQRLREIVGGIELDYLLAGVHCLDHLCIDSSHEYEKYFAVTHAGDLLSRYYDAVEELVQSRLFDAVAHFDVYKKYGLGFYGAEINALPEEKIGQTFTLMAKNATALEINTAGFRRNGEFYPNARIMALARNAGIELLTVGSDCHKPDDLGRGINEAIEYAKSFGFDAIYSFTSRKPVRMAI